MQCKRLLLIILLSCKFNLVQHGGGEKAPGTSFSLVVFTNIGISPQNLLNFSFNTFAVLA